MIFHKIYEVPYEKITEAETDENLWKEFIKQIKKSLNNNKAEKVRILRFLSDLKGLKGFHGWVPKDVSPDRDKGVYFEKLGFEIERLIKKYEKILEGI